MRYGVLGPLAVWGDDGNAVDLGGPNPRTLIGALLAHPNQVVSTDALIEAIWRDGPPSNPTSSLQVMVSRLRKAIGADRLVSRQPGYLLQIEPDGLDSEVFERLLREADQAHDAGDHADALNRIHDALDLWRGEAFADFLYDDFARAESTRLNELRERALEQELDALLSLGRHDEVVGRAKALLDGYPLREGLWGTYMLALYRAGRQADALRAYQQARHILGEELGIEPGPDLRQLEDRILQQDPQLDHDAGVPVAAIEAQERDLAVLVAMSTAEAGGSVDRVADTVEAFGGDVTQRQPAQIQAAFGEIRDAAEAAVSILGSEPPPALGIGLHWTTVRVRDSELVGLGVSRVTRVAASAPDGSVRVTAAAAERLRAQLPEDMSVVDIGERPLPGMSAPESLFSLAHPLLAEVESTVDLEPRTNLPALDRSSFVGRAQDIHDVRGLVESNRLVTLAGPGGVGKTRLALQVAADVVSRFADGVWLVELAELRDPSLVPDAVAAALDVTTDRGESVSAALRRASRDRRFLLVLDNCEHVIDDAAGLVDELLRAGDDIGVLATSQERLGLPGEVVHQVLGLSVPPAEALVPYDQLDAYDSVQLFAERARAVRAEFEIDESVATAVADVCRRLDGIPLAIELAASRLDALSASEVAAGLDDRFTTLGTGWQRGRAQRQRTLEAVIDWSHDLLDESQKVLLRRLSVFRGGFELAAAKAVCAFDPLIVDDVVAALSGLVAKNMVTARFSGGVARYSMLETIGAYSARQLDASSEAGEMTERHADYFAHVSESANAHLDGPDQATWITRMAVEHANAVAAMQRTLDTGDGPTAARIARPYPWYWLIRGPMGGGRRLLEQIFETAELPPDIEHDLRIGAGYLCAELGDYEDARSHFEHCLVLDRQVGDSGAMAATLTNLGKLAEIEYEYRTARRHHAAALTALAEVETRDSRHLARLIAAGNNMASTLRRLGEHAEAQEHLGMALRAGEEGGDQYTRCHATAQLAALLIDLGKRREATELLDEGELLNRELGDWSVRHLLARERARLHALEGDLHAARGLAEQALALVVDSNDRSQLPEAAETLATIALRQDDLDEAARHIEAALGRTAAGAVRVPGLHLAACVAAAQDDCHRAATLLQQATELQASRGSATKSDLVELLAVARERCGLAAPAVATPATAEAPNA